MKGRLVDRPCYQASVALTIIVLAAVGVYKLIDEDSEYRTELTVVGKAVLGVAVFVGGCLGLLLLALTALIIWKGF